MPPFAIGLQVSPAVNATPLTSAQTSDMLRQLQLARSGSASYSPLTLGNYLVRSWATDNGMSGLVQVTDQVKGAAFAAGGVPGATVVAPPHTGVHPPSPSTGATGPPAPGAGTTGGIGNLGGALLLGGLVWLFSRPAPAKRRRKTAKRKAKRKTTTRRKRRQPKAKSPQRRRRKTAKRKAKRKLTKKQLAAGFGGKARKRAARRRR